MNKQNKTCYTKGKTNLMGVVILVFALSLVTGVLGFQKNANAQTWQETLEPHFDIVETFDNLQDWHGTHAGGEYNDYYNPEDMPKYLDGSDSRWCMYSNWGDFDPDELDWIGDFGTGTHMGQTGKSAITDISNTRGPSRLGLCFGNGSCNSGYSDLHIFYMVKISRKQWPTRCELNGEDVSCSGTYGSTGIYEEGEPWAWIGGWKFNTLGTGFNDGGRWHDAPLTFEHRYGDAGIVGFIGLFNYGPIPRLDGQEPHVANNLIFNQVIAGPPVNQSLLNATDGGAITTITSDTRLGIDGRGSAIITDDWMGVEFHYVLEDPIENYNGMLEAWIYNSSGECLKTFKVTGFNFRRSSVSRADDLFNRFFFGGNNSNTYTWGPTMEGPYYVDDLIIDNNRIGPNYFDLLGDNPISFNITTSSLSNGATGTAYSQTLSAQGGTFPYTWSITSGSLPTNLNLNNATGIISGTPTTAGTSNFTIQATDSVSATDTQNLSITITEPDTESPTIPTNLTATAISANRIDLAWTASTDNVGVTGYNIYRCTGSSCSPITNIDTSTTNSYSDTSLNSETTYTYTVSTYDAVPNTSNQSNQSSATTQSSSAGGEININFQPSGSDIPSGYLVDSGSVFANRGNGYSYGWNSNNGNVRDRDSASSLDQRYDTLNHMQLEGGYTWEIELENGEYNVRIVAGDPDNYSGHDYRINAESTLIINGVPTTSNRWIEGTETITVSDGRLTISNATGSIQNRICFIEITSSGSSSTTYGISHFIQLLADWLQSIVSPFSVVDLNEDGIVNTRDLGIMMSNWEG